MDMGGMTTDNMTMMSNAVFFNAINTPLYSSAWAPSTPGQYAGTCIFLIALAILFRSLLAGRHLLEMRWADQAWKRRYITVAENTPFSERIKSDINSSRGTLMTNGVEEHVAILVRQTHGSAPWRFSVDVPRAALSMVIAGVAYLLMLAVMTFNIGYYFSILAGVFIGELAVGRYHHTLEEHNGH
jgi:solute carrier family 31 (copper transporter), member 1